MDRNNYTNERLKKIKKQNEILDGIISILIIVVLFALTTALSAWIFNTVMASDMPDWLKYLLLK